MSKKIVIGASGSRESHAWRVLPSLANKSFHKFVVYYAEISTIDKGSPCRATLNQMRQIGYLSF